MRKKILKQTTGLIMVTLIAGAAFLALIRSQFMGYPVKAAAENGHHEHDSENEPERHLNGRELFEQKGCINCHFTDSRETKVGPGLKGLFKRRFLPVSGRKASEENVRTQLKTPFKNMPSFANRLTEEERTALISYLKTL